MKMKMKEEDIKSINDLYLRTLKKAKKGMNYTERQLDKLNTLTKADLLLKIKEKSQKNRKVSRTLARISILTNPESRDYWIEKAKEKAEKAYTKMLLGKKIKDKNGKIRTIMPKNIKLSI